MLYRTRNDCIEIIAKALWDAVDEQGDYVVHIAWADVNEADKTGWRDRAAKVLNDLRLERRDGR